MNKLLLLISFAILFSSKNLLSLTEEKKQLISAINQQQTYSKPEFIKILQIIDPSLQENNNKKIKSACKKILVQLHPDKNTGEEKKVEDVFKKFMNFKAKYDNPVQAQKQAESNVGTTEETILLMKIFLNLMKGSYQRNELDEETKDKYEEYDNFVFMYETNKDTEIRRTQAARIRRIQEIERELFQREQAKKQQAAHSENSRGVTPVDSDGARLQEELQRLQQEQTDFERQEQEKRESREAAFEKLRKQDAERHSKEFNEMKQEQDLIFKRDHLQRQETNLRNILNSLKEQERSYNPNTNAWRSDKDSPERIREYEKFQNQRIAAEKELKYFLNAKLDKRFKNDFFDNQPLTIDFHQSHAFDKAFQTYKKLPFQEYAWPGVVKSIETLFEK